ncbi:hypothetical protein K1T71_003245 [Dendrolimus kikuchii]|uniref:Uncharacterized protein n=1 Tax=Dendrolimus kikuchii TaxID=765133 RepID=A0ACC1DBF6_9NEOP|nr:hypothetical protein K1T71_003245 [Dendrolimus kikuchii]
MTVILTPARTLLTSDSHCSPSSIECQVSGARVCIDSLATCDGIPNCGSYDIYDEDRLMCGGALGMLHNVYLAAFTFLAAILTMFYVVHYWLKQYVPKVSEAFFIYINGIENILYLDSIMRHPNESEDDEISKLIYHGNIFEDDILYATDIKTNKINIFKYLKNIFTSDCLRKKRPIQDDILFSTFPETELRYIQKESADTAVQTGESLEMAHFHSPVKKIVKQDSHNKFTLTPISEIDVSGTSAAMLDATLSGDNADELSMLKFFRKSRSDSIRSTSFDTLTQNEGIPVQTNVTTLEKEIIIHEYDRPSPESAGPSTKNDNFADNSGTLQRQIQTKKQLRFNDDATIIPSMEFGKPEIESNEDNSCRRGVDLGKIRSPDCNKIDNYNNGGRRFWSKSKKQKRRKQQ